jgi:hypothetical protein
MKEKFEDGYLVHRSEHKVGQEFFIVEVNNRDKAKVLKAKLVDMDWGYEGEILYYFKTKQKERFEISQYRIFKREEEAECWAKNYNLSH